MPALFPNSGEPLQSMQSEEIIDTDNGTTDVGGDTEHTPCAVDESATDAATRPAGDNAARNLFIDFAKKW